MIIIELIILTTQQNAGLFRITPAEAIILAAVIQAAITAIGWLVNRKVEKTA